MPVKRERSPSPSLALAPPRLVTEGCVRIAPLPPECRNRQPNFQTARLQLAATEMKKLRALGLQIVRVFTREDGMVIDWKSPHPVLSDTLRPPPPPPPPASEPVVFHIAADAAPARGVGTAQPPPTKPVQPAVTEPVQLANPSTEHPANRPKKRRKQKVSSYGAPDGVVLKPSAELGVQLTGDPSRIAGPSPSTVSSIASQPTLPASDQRRVPAPPQRIPPAAKKPADRSCRSIPRLSSDIIDLTEDGPPSIPALPSHAVGLIPKTPHSALPDTSSRSRATHRPPPASGPPSCPSSTNGGPATSTTGSATLPPPVHAPAPPARIADGELEDAALDFIERYIHVFTTARAALAAAYSPSALYSFQYQSPRGPAAHKYLPAPRQGRPDILAALLALPPTLTLCSFPPRPSAHELVWDVGRVPGSVSGDVLLVCYAVQDFDWNVVARANGNGKEKEKEEEKERWSFIQRFILRRRDGDGDEDEDDRAVAALWPLVAVSHQITLRRLL
ncbi:hypothetical protein LXA43DRAFT_215952 [Ganoderma leucocontextum]|nr:hypothetical protein LXA43DRAFT_215952 [Ganoderma leucocontextum]